MLHDDDKRPVFVDTSTSIARDPYEIYVEVTWYPWRTVYTFVYNHQEVRDRLARIRLNRWLEENYGCTCGR